MLKRVHWSSWAVVALLALGSLIRLVDLTDPPLDSHAWRQLRSASIARAMYYQANEGADPALRELAIKLGRFEPLEPPLFEHLLAFTYRLLGGESLWIARLYSILFWLIGGVALYLAAKAFSSRLGGIAALMAYLLLPFSVIVSRSFLPDVPMTALAAIAIYAIYRWSQAKRWSWALVAGLTAGLAILVKVFAVFPLAVCTIFLAARGSRITRFLRDPQLWTLALLAGIIPGSYYLGIRQGSASEYLSNWVLPFSNLWIDPEFYVRWAAAIHRSVTIPVALLGLVGLLIAPEKGRMLLLGLWVGYALMGAAVPSLIVSHDYYQTILIPIAALSLAPLGDRLLKRLGSTPSPWRPALAALGLLGVAALAVISVRALLERDYRPEILGWIKMGRELPQDAALIGLTHDYNLRIRYYGWRNVDQWPHASDFEMQALAGGNYDPRDPSIAAQVERRIAGYDYFVVTLFDELERQPVVKRTLEDRFPQRDGEGYILYDLRSGD